MENPEIKIIPEGTELTIRRGSAPEIKPPEPVSISGNIDSPFRWIQQRKNEFPHKSAYILVNRENMKISLRINERDFYADGIKGQLEMHPKFKEFGINTGKYMAAHAMAELIKMNRTFFETQAHAMTLVSELKNVRVKVDRELEKADNNRGDRRSLVAQQVISSNVPERFNLVVPIFKGQPKETFEVEVYFNPDDLSCTLVSPQANDLIQTVCDHIIDEQLGLINKECPEIVQIEQ